MAHLSIRRQVAASPAEVFRRASDFPNAADFISGITKMEMLTDGPIGLGTRFRETRIMFKKEATEEMEVTAFDPPRSYTLGCESCGCRYRSEFRFKENGDGTEVEMSFESTPLTFMAKVMGVVFRPMMKMMEKHIARDLDDLKASIEERPESAHS